jgi:hypothetical protein
MPSFRHECVPAAARTRHRPRPPLVPAARFPDMPGRVECDVCPRQLTAVECRPPLALVRWQRVDAVPGRPGSAAPGATRDWVLYWRDRHLCFACMTSLSHHRASVWTRETGRPDRDLPGIGASRLRRPHGAGTSLCRWQPRPARHSVLGHELFRDLTSCARLSPDPAAATSPKWLWL